MFPTFVLAAALGVPPCWDIFDGALRHSALAEHPTYVSYNERISVKDDDQQLIYSNAHVDYRDDGTSRVIDERFDFQPIVVHHFEPGPPELGPYGASRESWFPTDTIDGIPSIAHVRAAGNLRCTVQGLETYKGHPTYHLTFSGGTPGRPSIEEMWVDAGSREVWKLKLSGYVYFVSATGGSAPLADFQVELGYEGPYLVVRHVVWEYRRREYSQYSVYFGEYDFTQYSFPQTLPESYFGDAGT